MSGAHCVSPSVSGQLPVCRGRFRRAFGCNCWFVPYVSHPHLTMPLQTDSRLGIDGPQGLEGLTAMPE